MLHVDADGAECSLLAHSVVNACGAAPMAMPTLSKLTKLPVGFRRQALYKCFDPRWTHQKQIYFFTIQSQTSALVVFF